jgi:hypothetical protein
LGFHIGKYNKKNMRWIWPFIAVILLATVILMGVGVIHTRDSKINREEHVDEIPNLLKQLQKSYGVTPYHSSPSPSSPSPSSPSPSSLSPSSPSSSSPSFNSSHIPISKDEPIILLISHRQEEHPELHSLLREHTETKKYKIIPNQDVDDDTTIHSLAHIAALEWVQKQPVGTKVLIIDDAITTSCDTVHNAIQLLYKKHNCSVMFCDINSIQGTMCVNNTCSVKYFKNMHSPYIVQKQSDEDGIIKSLCKNLMDFVHSTSKSNSKSSDSLLLDMWNHAVTRRGVFCVC